MDQHEGSFLDGKRKMFSSNSSIVHSPSLVRESYRRPNRTGAILKSMQLIDDAVANTTPMVSTITKTHTNQYDTSKLNFSKSLLTGYTGIEDHNMSRLSMPSDFGAMESLMEPKTPAAFARRDKSSRFEPERNPCETVTTSLFNEFKQNLCECESSLDVFSMVDAMEESCTEHVQLLSKSAASQFTDRDDSVMDLRQMLTSEKQTWRLVSSLFRDRLAEADKDEDMTVDLKNQVMSEKEAVGRFFDQNTDVRQAQIVIDWLEQNASDDFEGVVEQSRHYTGRVCWENTLHTLKKHTEQGIEPNCVSEMDPDAPTRTRSPLIDLDVEDENLLLKCAFSCIRAGKIDRAQELCLAHGQAWRAASLEGWRLFHDPNYAENATDTLTSLEGNPNRKLWKIAAWHMSKNNAYNEIERAIYGALCGNLKAMLDVCTSWEDCLWAHFKTMVELNVEQHIQNSPNLQLPWQQVVGGALSIPEEYWMQRVTQHEQIFEKMEGSYNQTVQDEGKMPYHFIQKCLILGNVDALLEEALEWLTDIHPHLLRFLAHLILFLKSIGIAFNVEHADTILKAFVSFLIQDESTSHMVAMYTAFLPKDEQLSSYAEFLSTVEDPQLRHEFLQLAEEAGLDIPSITKKVVEQIRAEGEPDLVDISVLHGHDEKMPIDLHISASDRKKIDAIDWLVFDRSQRCEALKQSNAVVRMFLAGRKLSAAKEVLLKIPSDSIDVVYTEWGHKADSSVPLPPDKDNTIKEHLCLQAYLETQQAFSDWFKHYHNKPSASNPAEPTSMYNSVSISELVAEELRQKKFDDDVIMWKDRLEQFCDSVAKKIYNVLLFPQGWLADNAEQLEDKDESREQQLATLREQCIPSLCDLLITVLTSTENHNSECAKLADVIASEDHKLYKLFSDSEGRKLLNRIQDAMIDTL
uniref:Nuclear pore complex protein n=1 Tax=Phallusia mammillata TaxID=59560 RepID=A0A6F9DM25_9ASCI|nr:nuclear pore complex protein Nup107-like [Phallusia mammillata]